jgi:hypothetical protein
MNTMEERNSLQPIKLFYCYAHKDRILRDELDSHLTGLRRPGLIATWFDGEIIPGTAWEEEIETQLSIADVILLLISPEFLRSDYCYGKEMKRALERHSLKEAWIVPILLRPVDWQDTPFAKLQMLPTNALPITRWHNRDEAFEDVAQGIRRVVRDLLSRPPTTPLKQAQPKQVHSIAINNNGTVQRQIIGDNTNYTENHTHNHYPNQTSPGIACPNCHAETYRLYGNRESGRIYECLNCHKTLTVSYDGTNITRIAMAGVILLEGVSQIYNYLQHQSLSDGTITESLDS